MNAQEALKQAKVNLTPNEDGSYNIKELIDEVARLIDFDPDQQRRVKAKKVIDAAKRPGATESDGQLTLPGLGSYAYEPERLVEDDDGHIIDQAKATTVHKDAEAKRARKTAAAQAIWADRKTNEAAEFAAWVIREMTGGRNRDELVFDPFVREEGYWESGEAAPEEGPPGDDE